MATGDNTWFNSDGKSVEVDLLYTVTNMQVAYIEGFLGIAVGAGDSGDTVALTIDRREYQFTVPAGLSVGKGATVYIDTTDLTGHTPDDTGYATSSGANLVALFKAVTAKDGNNVCRGILLPEGV